MSEEPDLLTPAIEIVWINAQDPCQSSDQASETVSRLLCQATSDAY